MDIFVSYGAAAALLVLTVGIVIQMKKVYMLRNAVAISTGEIILRFLASAMLVVKFATIHDWYLIIGQGIFTFVYLCYVLLILFTNYSNRRV